MASRSRLRLARAERRGRQRDRLRALLAGRRAHASCASATSRRFRARATAWGCRGPASGARRSTPMTAGTAAPASATATRSRPRSSAGTARNGRRTCTLPPLGVIWLTPQTRLDSARLESEGHPIWPGRPFPLGATWDGRGTNFSFFSENAERVELCLFDDGGRRAALSAERAHGVQLARLRPGRGAGPALRLRVHGPYAPERGHRFNPAKLLLDPYAKAIGGGVRWEAANTLPYRPGAPGAGDLPDGSDDAAAMPRCVVIDPGFDWEGDSPARDALARDGDLRAARQGLHAPAPGRARGSARHLCGACLRGGHRTISRRSA